MPKTLVEILEENDINLKKKGDKYVATCPFHEGDNTPSFTVYPNESYYCFACEVWGDPVKFLVEYCHYETKQALEYVGIDYKSKRRKSEVIKVKNLLKTYDLVSRVADHYHLYLKEMDGALNYLKNRGLSEETIDKYKIGYTDGAILNISNVFEHSIAIEIGLISDNGYELLSHRITVPNIVDRGLVDFMIGRTVVKDRVKYLGLRMPKPVQGFFELRNSPVLFLVEGQFDWLILRQWGYPAVVMSGSHISRANLSLLRDKFVLVVPDNDKTGINAATGIKNSLPNADILKWDDKKQKDISAYVSAGFDRSDFDTAIKESLWRQSSFQKNWMTWLPVSITTELSVLT